ncbi:MAG: hypothetical protein FWG03_03355 [Clostridiales bacterium]|nr:hypothetical protein [Clostridiales bacterium]
MDNGQQGLTGMEHERRAQLHDDFWRRKNKECLIGFSPGDYFISRRFSAAAPLLGSCGGTGSCGGIGPEAIDPGSYLPDYERMYGDAMAFGGDLFYTPEPMPGLPWLEAMSGFPVYSSTSSFYATEAKALDAGKIVCPGWLDKYQAFLGMLSEKGRDRYLCGQPILRGPADLLGTGIGQQQLIYEMVDHPVETKKNLEAFAGLLLRVLKLSNPGTMFGGHAMGFYHLWCPGECLWFQDDLTAIMSPGLYKEFLYDIHDRLAKSAPYTMMHLHMTSSYIVEFLLEMEGLSAIQVNKDIGEPVEPMLPLLKKIREVKNLVLWGDFTPGEVKLLCSELEPQGVYIIVFGAGTA